MNNLFYDGFNSKLIETAFFDGIFEIPILKAPLEIMLPTVAIKQKQKLTALDNLGFQNLGH